MNLALEERFWSKVDKSDGCWVWTAWNNGQGYGRFSGGRGATYAHRFSYELARDAIPDGLQLDHLCRNRGCVNPAHLEPVTNRENALRGATATKTHCKHSHPFDVGNTYITPAGHRDCRACHRRNEASRRRSGYGRRGEQ